MSGTSSRPAFGRCLDPGLPRLVAEQPVEAVGLQGEEVRDLEGLADLREGDAAGGGAAGAVAGCWWACWRCARRPRGVLPRARRTLCVRACRTARGKWPRGQVRWQRKASSIPARARRPQVALRRPCGPRAGHWNCHGASRMTPLGLRRQAPPRDRGPDRWAVQGRPGRRASEGDDLADQPAAVDPVHASAGPGSGRPSGRPAGSRSWSGSRTAAPPPGSASARTTDEAATSALTTALTSVAVGPHHGLGGLGVVVDEVTGEPGLGPGEVAVQVPVVVGENVHRGGLGRGDGLGAGLLGPVGAAGPHGEQPGRDQQAPPRRGRRPAAAGRRRVAARAGRSFSSHIGSVGTGRSSTARTARALSGDRSLTCHQDLLSPRTAGRRRASGRRGGPGRAASGSAAWSAWRRPSWSPCCRPRRGPGPSPRRR